MTSEFELNSFVFQVLFLLQYCFTKCFRFDDRCYTQTRTNMRLDTVIGCIREELRITPTEPTVSGQIDIQGFLSLSLLVNVAPLR